MTVYHAHPIPGIPIVEPEHEPLPEDVFLGYEIITPKHKGPFAKPDPKHMNKTGYISVVLLAIMFWPISCIPCCLKCSYSNVQRPVYKKYIENQFTLSQIKEETNPKQD